MSGKCLPDSRQKTHRLALSQCFIMQEPREGVSVGFLRGVTSHPHPPRHPGDPGVCQGGESILWAPILAFSFIMQMNGVKLGPVRTCKSKLSRRFFHNQSRGCAKGSSDASISDFSVKSRCSWCQTSLAGRITMARSLGTAVMTHSKTSALGLLNPEGRPLRSCPVSSTKNCMALEVEACLDSISLTLCGHQFQAGHIA